MQQFLYELRSMPIWLLQIYLEEIGGSSVADGSFSGDGWNAKIEKMDDFQIGSLRVGQIGLEWWGNEQAIKNVLPLLEQKMMRAGG